MTIKYISHMEASLYANLAGARKVADLLLRIKSVREDSRVFPMTSSSGNKYVLLQTDSDAILYQIDMEMPSYEAFKSAPNDPFVYLNNPISFSAIGMFDAFGECICEDNADVMVEKLLEEIFFGTFAHEGLRFWISAMSLYWAEKRKAKAADQK